MSIVYGDVCGGTKSRAERSGPADTSFLCLVSSFYVHFGLRVDWKVLLSQPVLLYAINIHQAGKSTFAYHYLKKKNVFCTVETSVVLKSRVNWFSIVAINPFELLQKCSITVF